MISADQHTVADVLGEKFIHEIPPYQRPYAWTDQEASQLLEDIKDAAATDANEPYFLGSIVLIRAPGSHVGQVVDGQQRLTTITILAAVLRDVAEHPAEKSAISQIVYKEPNEFMGQVEAVRIRAHAEDRVFFRETIQFPGATSQEYCPQQPKTDAQRLMWGNARSLRKSICSLTSEVRQALVKFLLTKSVLVVVSTDSRASALRIFRVLNDRGLDLTNSDIIKADLLEKFGESGELTHQAARWRELETDLGREDFEGLLEHIRFMRDKGKIRTTLSESYLQRFKGSNAQVVRSFLDEELAPAKLWYTRIVDADTSEASLGGATNFGGEALAGLLLLPNKDWIAVALSILLKFGANDTADYYLKKLEGLAWIMQLSRKYDTERLNRYAGVMRALEEGEIVFCKELSINDLESYSAWNALNGPLYDNFPTRVVRAILERLDRLLAEQAVIWNGQKSVEHILPQEPAVGQWNDFDLKQRSDNVHRLGNLVLLTKKKNSSASNFEYSKKKEIYFGLKDKHRKIATYASVQELAHIPCWTPAELISRQDRHTSILAERWGIDVKSAKLVAEMLT